AYEWLPAWHDLGTRAISAEMIEKKYSNAEDLLPSLWQVGEQNADPLTLCFNLLMFFFYISS
ncbi:hypothetical protein ACJX0J_008005, partial [Zea mays]